MSRRISKEVAELQAAGLAVRQIEQSEQLQPSLRAQKQAPVGPELGLANSSVTCSASAQGYSDALSLGSVSAQSRLR
jgi:hypothetical protein